MDEDDEMKIYGDDMARIWRGSGEDLARIWRGSGEDLARIWLGSGEGYGEDA
jgi:hypothetical protein